MLGQVRATRFPFNPRMALPHTPGIAQWMLDMGDLSTMFSDSAGTTPATIEGTCGLKLDTSVRPSIGYSRDPITKLVVGPELVANGITDFTDTAAATHTANSVTVTVGGNGIVKSIFTVGKTYKVTISGTTTSSLSVNTTNALVPTSRKEFMVGFGTCYIVADTAFIYIRLASIGNASSVVLSVREVPGNHFIQPDPARRPVISALVNMLRKTEGFADSAWVCASSDGGVLAVKTPNYGVAPDGTATACRVQLDVASGATGAISQMYQAYAPGAISLKNSCWIKTANGTTKTIKAFSTGTVTPGTMTVTGEWTLLESTRTGSASDSFQFAVVKGATSAVADLLIWHPDSRPANAGSRLPRYQMVNTVTDYAINGFPPRLQQSPTNTAFMQSADTVDFTGSDAMTVFWGGRSLDDTGTFPTIAELSASSGLNNGTFNLYRFSASKVYGFDSKGTVKGSVVSQALASPVSNVVSGTSKISIDSLRMRVDALQVGQSNTDQGTGPFGTYQMFLFMRGGVSLPFTGYTNAFMGCGAILNDHVLRKIEGWTAAQMRL